MSLWGCFLLSFLPVAAAFFLWFFCKRFVWFEALILAASGFVVSSIYYFCVTYSAYDDVETWSGCVVNAVHQPPWLEYYEYAVYRTEVRTGYTTDAKGHMHSYTYTVQVFDHWQPTERWHSDSWSAQDTLIGSYGITSIRFEDIHTKFGGLAPTPGVRYTFDHNSRMISGDPNDYEVINNNHYVYPVTTEKHWENRVKACPSVFSYKPVPSTIKVFEYPKNGDHFSSDRLLGPIGINHEKWDQMNSILGPTKKVNVIICAFGDEGADMGEYQEAKWIGGKKNDIIITFGGGTNTKPTWVHVFGWSESDLAKLNIESIILKTGANDSAIPLIQAEIKEHYIIKNWHKFDYLRAEIPFVHYFWLLLLIGGVGGIWIFFSIKIDIEKEGVEDSLSYDGLKQSKTRQHGRRMPTYRR